MPIKNTSSRVQKATTSRIRKAPTKPAKPKTWREAAEEYDLEDWYSSEDAKRTLTPLCRAVNVQNTAVKLLGSPARPLASLVPASSIQPSQADVNLTLDEARSDWAAVTGACIMFGTVFRLSGKAFEHAVLVRDETNRHPAMRYRRPQIEDMGQNFSMLLDDFRELGEKLSATTAIMHNRFREVWRENNVTTR